MKKRMSARIVFIDPTFLPYTSKITKIKKKEKKRKSGHVERIFSKEIKHIIVKK